MKATDSAIVKLNLEVWLEAEKVPESERPQIRELAKHSISCYTENGEHIKHPFDTENLLCVLMGMERYIVDSNLPGSVHDAKKPENRNKAFILGQTFTDERENLEDALLGSNADNSNNNLFDFGYVGEEITWLPTPCLMINRLDAHQRITFDTKGLRMESRSREKRRKDDPEFIEMEQEQARNILGMKNLVLQKLSLSNIKCLPPAPFRERKRLKLIEVVRENAQNCFKNYTMGVEVATLCYAALLLEPDEDRVGKKTRKEFQEAGRRNVFGDTRLIQNALWLKARILSDDGAVKRMVEYLDLPEIAVPEIA